MTCQKASDLVHFQYSAFQSNSSLPILQFSNLPVFQSSCILVFQSSSFPIFQHSSIPVFQDSSLPVFLRSSSVSVFLCYNIPVTFQRHIESFSALTDVFFKYSSARNITPTYKFVRHKS